jgi:MFS family permease
LQISGAAAAKDEKSSHMSLSFKNHRFGPDITWGLYGPLLAHAVLIHTVVSMGRVTTSYRALELGLPVVTLGLIQGAFYLVPVFIAVTVGRYIDRGHDAESAWIGSGLVALGSIVAWAIGTSTAMLLIASIICGMGHVFLMASHQMLCLRAATETGREGAFGTFMICTAIGQAAGPLVVGLAGGGAHVAPTQFLFALAAVLGLICIAVGLLIKPDHQMLKSAANHPHAPLADLLKTPGLITLMVASIVSVTAQDLTIIYLPLLGTERAIDVSQIGIVLSLRSGASMVSRVFYTRLLERLGRYPLLVSSLVLSGVGCAALAIPLPVLGLCGASAMMGLGLGVATTLSITSLVAIAPEAVRGTINSIRITGNRIGQVSLPLIAGGIAFGTGAAGVLVLSGIALAASGIAIHLDRRH